MVCIGLGSGRVCWDLGCFVGFVFGFCVCLSVLIHSLLKNCLFGHILAFGLSGWFVLVWFVLDMFLVQFCKVHGAFDGKTHMSWCISLGSGGRCPDSWILWLCPGLYKSSIKKWRFLIYLGLRPLLGDSGCFFVYSYFLLFGLGWSSLVFLGFVVLFRFI